MAFSQNTTPRQNSPARRIFEHATQQGNTARIASIGIDTRVEATIANILRDHTGMDALLSELPADGANHQVMDMVSTSDNWTDSLRYAAAVTFMHERVVIPVTFNRSECQEIRDRTADGILGKALDLIEPVVEFIDSYQMRSTALLKHDQVQLQEAKGWVQEMTIMALINYPQNADLVALPSSTIQDLKESTDLICYLQDHSIGYQIPISIKSSTESTRNEECRRPKLCVVGAADIGNLDLVITRLLLRQHNGYPGLSDSEEAAIHAAREIVLSKLTKWVEKMHVSRSSRNSPAPSIDARLGQIAHNARY